MTTVELTPDQCRKIRALAMEKASSLYFAVKPERGEDETQRMNKLVEEYRVIASLFEER